jgi:adenosylcobinamide-GDP ribazoletransferase
MTEPTAPEPVVRPTDVAGLPAPPLRGPRLWLCHWLLAVQFFTRIPVTGRLASWAPYSAQALTRSTRFFPLVGIVVGAFGALIYMAAAQVLPGNVAVVLSMCATIWITGAFHEDGWADFCDAFGTSSDREKTLLIMTDSRIGAYGAIGLIMMLGLKLHVLLALDETWMVSTLICAHAISRGWAVVIMRALPYAKPMDDSKSKPIAQALRGDDALMAWMFALLPAVMLAWWIDSVLSIACGFILSALGTVWMARIMARRLQGYTGDGLGATQQLTEVLFLIGVLAWWEA